MASDFLVQLRLSKSNERLAYENIYRYIQNEKVTFGLVRVKEITLQKGK